MHIGTATLARTRKRFVEEGLEAALSERPRAGARRKLEGKQEALLVALACGAPTCGLSSKRPANPGGSLFRWRMPTSNHPQTAGGDYILMVHL